MSHNYLVQAKHDDWVTVCVGGRGFCEGYMYCAKRPAPHLAHRLIKLAEPRAWFDRTPVDEREVVKIVDQFSAKDDVHIGVIAGWPSARQYERAGEKALEKARQIREQDEVRNERLSR